MKNLRSLIIKFIMILAIFSIVFGSFYGVSIGDILSISLILTMGSYLIGDLYILPMFGNIAATLADFGIVYFGSWLIGAAIIEKPISVGSASFFSALLIAIGEAFFHRYVVRNVLYDTEIKRSRNTNYQTTALYQTEISEESRPNLKNLAANTDTEFAEEEELLLESSDPIAKLEDDTENASKGLNIDETGADNMDSAITYNIGTYIDGYGYVPHRTKSADQEVQNKRK